MSLVFGSIVVAAAFFQALTNPAPLEDPSLTDPPTTDDARKSHASEGDSGEPREASGEPRDPSSGDREGSPKAEGRALSKARKNVSC